MFTSELDGPSRAKPRWISIAIVAFIICIIAVGGGFAYSYHQQQLAAQAREELSLKRSTLQAQFKKLVSVLGTVTTTRDDLKNSIDALNNTIAEGSTASEQRHQDSISSSPSLRAELSYSDTELTAVNSMAPEISAIETDCNSIVNVFSDQYGSASIADLKADCAKAVNAWRKDEDNWWRAINTINSDLQERANGQWWTGYSGDVTEYYHASDEAASDAETAINSAQSEMDNLSHRLGADIASKTTELGALK